jgi:hypothetical protein
MMMRRFLVLGSLAAAASLGTASAFTACDPNDPARALVVNDLPAEGPESFTVEKAWYRTTLFFRPVKPGEGSEMPSVGYGREHAYFILSAGDPAKRFLAMSTAEIEVAVGEQSRIIVNASTIRSTCVGATRLGEADWNFIHERIFPGDEVEAFGASCVIPSGADGGAEGGEGGAGDAAGD